MSKMRRDEESATITMPSSQRSLEECLQRTAKLLSHKVSESDLRDWSQFLGSYSDKAIEYAFEKWHEKAKLFFPKIKEILDLCQQFQSENRVEFRSCGKCDSDGYIEFEASEARTRSGIQLSYKPRVVTRCQCWTEYASRRKRAS